MRWPKVFRLDAALVGFAAFVFTSTLVSTFVFYHPIPFQDHWYSLRFFEEYLNGELTLKSLWSQHNEHRIILPGLLFLLDYIWAQGTGYLLLVLIFLVQGAHALLLGRWVPFQSGFSGKGRLIFGSLGVVFSFWLIQSENLSSPHQISFLMGGFFASVAAILVCRLEPSFNEKRIFVAMGLAGLSCLASTYSLANGALMWVILPVIAWKAGVRGKVLVLWGLFGTAVMVSYLTGYHTPQEQSSPFNAVHWRTLHYLMGFMGNPLTPRSILAGSVLGATGIVLLAWFARLFFLEEKPGFAKKFGMSLAVFSLGTGILTAIGRQESGVYQATCSRYQTTALLFWFALALLVFAYYGSLPKVTRWIRIGTAILFLGAVFPTQISALGWGLKLQYLKSDEASLALLSGVLDTTTSRFLHPDDSLMISRMEFMRLHRLSVYREPWPPVFGSRINAEIQELRTVSSMRPGFFLRGKVKMAEGAAIPKVIAVVDSGTIIGFLKTRWRPCRGCFSGYVRGEVGRKYELFGI